MISVDGGRKMPCESCGVQFSVFRRKRACSECERLYCAACLRRGGGMCSSCRALCTRPLARHAIAHLKARDLQCFLQRQGVSTRGCVEKEELVSLCISHVNSSAYRRHGSASSTRPSSGPFTTLKGLTSNINDLINSAFELRPTATPQPAPPPRNYCYNSAHAHAAPPPPAPTHHERFTTTPGGERDFRVPPPAQGGRSRSSSAGSARLDTADCFEVEDVDDAGWEFVTRPADPLPGDSEILLTANEARLEQAQAETMARGEGAVRGGAEPAAAEAARGEASAGGTPARAASELDLRPPPRDADASSLQDQPLMDDQTTTEAESESRRGGSEGAAEAEAAGAGAGGRECVRLEEVRSEAQLAALSVRQLKLLLARNRVDFRACLERADLLARAAALYRDHHKYKDVEALPPEEWCKICMAAPLECVLLECGHIAACTACARQLPACPICRQYVVRAVRFFRS